MTEVKTLPNGWALSKVGLVGEVRLGRQRSPKNRSSKHPTKYIRAANLTWTGLKLGDVLDMEFEPHEVDAYRLRTGDVLLSEASGSAGEVGKPVVWNGEIDDCCFQNTVIRFRSRGGVLPQYAHVIFSHFARNGVFARVSKGVGIHHLSADRFAEMVLPVPPLGEQRRIVAKIEELFSDLDAGVAALVRVRANLERYRAAVLHAAVNGKLTEAWRRANRPSTPASELLLRILDGRRKKWEDDRRRKFVEAGKSPPNDLHGKYPVPPEPDTTLLHPLPDGWGWATLSQIGFVDRGRSRHRPRDAAHLYGGPYPFVQTGEVGGANTFIRSYTQTYSEAGLAQSRLWPSGTLCITIAANIAETAILGFDACFPDSVVGFLPASNEVSVRYVELYLRTIQESLEHHAPATAQKNINLETLTHVVVRLPPRAEQDEIVAEVDRRFSVVDAVEAEVEHGLNRAARLRQAILKRAFEARLVPQDSSDEPAAVLLDRIRSERASSPAAKSGRTPERRVAKKKSRVAAGEELFDAHVLDANQQERALEAMRTYLSAAPNAEGKTPAEVQAERDRRRRELVAEKLKPLLDAYLSGRVALADFKSQIDGINKRHEYWGFKGIKGQMFFNMVVNTATNVAECDQELKAVLPVPAGEEIAKSRLRTFASYVKRLGDDHLEQGGGKQGRPKVGSVPFFVSYFWQIEEPKVWPVYYTNSVQVMDDLNLWRPTGDPAEDYIQYKHIHEELAALFTGTSGRPFDLYEVEHVFWLHGGNPYGMTKEVTGGDGAGTEQIEVVKPVVTVVTTDGKLPDSYVPPIVAVLPQMALNDPKLIEAAKASGTSLERAFEKSVNAAFTILGYDTQLLGQGQGRVPDGRAFDLDDSYALLWDGKVRSAGYNMGTDDRTIREYITTQSRELKRRRSLRNIYYLIVSSGFQDDGDDLIRMLKMDTDVNEVVLLTAEALVAMVDMKLRDPHQVTLGPDGLQRLFTSSGILMAEDIREILG